MNRGKLRINESSCNVQQLSHQFKTSLVWPPAEITIPNAINLPLCIKYQRNCRYQNFIPTVLLIEILQELKNKEELHKINGISVNYLTTKRLVDDSVILHLNGVEFEHELEKVLLELGNLNIESMLEFQIMAHLDIWAQTNTSVSDNASIYIYIYTE
jgi:hypothetical protein